MPIYGFTCQACETGFEELMRISDTTPPVCPSCGSTQTLRALSNVAPPGRSAGFIASARKQAAKEGHFSNYSRAEVKKALK